MKRMKKAMKNVSLECSSFTSLTFVLWLKVKPIHKGMSREGGGGVLSSSGRA
jgi:hypothetical protein